MAGIKKEIKGTGNEVVGKIKAAVGKVLHKPKLQAKGKAEVKIGKAEKNLGNAERKVIGAKQAAKKPVVRAQKKVKKAVRR
jgi:uncharacterized protein YjbJ (UPF0337 family)